MTLMETSDMSDDEYDEDYDDSDRELQEAFSKGLLKPGLNIPYVVPDNFEDDNKVINDEEALKEKYKALHLNLPWIERLDIIHTPAPLAPELAAKLAEQEEMLAVGRTTDIVFNDFKRETMFTQQAQAAVIEGMARLKELGIPLRRPDDYFAEMVKTDEHMQRVRKSILRKQRGIEVGEKTKKLREQKKMAKQVQKEAMVRKIDDKRKMNEEIQKFRKGIRKDLDFLEPKGKGGNTSASKKPQKLNKKREEKNRKFGFGGKKRGKKRNNNLDDVGGKKKGKSGGGGGGGMIPGKLKKSAKLKAKIANKAAGGGGAGGKMPRPGKSKRAQMKNKRR
uniref:Probable rRNA-processing protein EBP2 homolog n=1 Tax=Cacopsylla melanoneura TaxID=428564 RepID=A0A8D8PR01_9HEMI